MQDIIALGCDKTLRWLRLRRDFAASDVVSRVRLRRAFDADVVPFGRLWRLLT